MILQLQPPQVSDYWDKIKLAAITSMDLDPLDAKTSEYSNNLFISLLNELHQAWLIMDEDRNIYAVGITCILEDPLTGTCTLHVDAFYSFLKMTPDIAKETTEYVVSYARSIKCTQIKAETSNSRAARLLELVGFEPSKMEYILQCG